MLRKKSSFSSSRLLKLCVLLPLAQPVERHPSAACSQGGTGRLLHFGACRRAAEWKAHLAGREEGEKQGRKEGRSRDLPCPAVFCWEEIHELLRAPPGVRWREPRQQLCAAGPGGAGRHSQP